LARGARLKAKYGDIPVEELCNADRLQVLSGGTQPVRWIGFRHVKCLSHLYREQIWPVRISAGAFSPGQPCRDLFLSPDHAVYLIDVLIPVKLLSNGRSVVQGPMDEVTYYHIDMPAHDVLLAEGLSVES